MTELAPSSSFREAFRRWARRVRARVLLRAALGGAAAGAGVGALAAGALWWAHEQALIPWTSLLTGVGALGGLAWAQRRRWSDLDLALYLDGRLESRELVATAVAGAGEDEVRAVVLQRAAELLHREDPRRARPRVVSRWHAALWLGLAASAGLVLAPPAPRPAAPEVAPGAERVQLGQVEGLDRIEALARLPTSDRAQAKRLAELADRAQRLREQLRQGMEKREALAQLAKLRDDVSAEQLALGDRANRAGTDAAAEALSRHTGTQRAAKALGDGDLIEFDREMQRLANQAEQSARQAAKEALEQAERAAKARGAEALSQELGEQRRLFAEREQQAEALRELAEALRSQGGLRPEQEELLREFGEQGSPETQRQLTESLGDALLELSEAERRQLLENLRRRAAQTEGNAPAPGTRRQLEDLARQLATEPGREALREQLRQLAQPPASEGAEREGALGEAERGGAEAQRQLGMPLPSEGPSTPGAGQPGASPGKGGAAPKAGAQGDPNGGKGQPGGPGGGGEHGAHEGTTERVTGEELRAKASARPLPGLPFQGAGVGRAPARPGETANQVGVEALGSLGAAELGGVEGSELPQEYREQVGRYFQP